jgi:predicted Zn-dependent peptidase
VIRIATGSILLAVSLGALAAADDVPAHPRDLVYPELDFAPPDAAAHRFKLQNGLTAYLVPDATLPAVRIRAYIRTGSIYDPEGQEGLAGLTFATLRTCGAGALDPAEVEAKLDELGATIDSDCSEVRATVEAWMLASKTDAVVDLLADVIRRPGFDEDRFNRSRDDTANESKNDEDDSGTLATRRIREELYGEHPYARFRTKESLAKLTREDAKKFHKANVTPARTVLAISGAFEKEAMQKLLEKHFGSWKAEGEGWKPVEKVERPKGKGSITILDRPDMTAAYIELGHLGIKAGAKDEAALLLTDHIWGSGSFTSRVVAKVRTEEGLAYTCGSDFDTPPVVPGLVRTYMQSQAVEASYALKLSLDEAKRLAEQGPTKEELERAKRALIGKAPARFTTASDRARALAEADLDGAPEDNYATYAKRIAAVTPEDIKAAAAKYYGADGLVIIVVGPQSSVRKSAARGTSLDELGRVKVE